MGYHPHPLYCDAYYLCQKVGNKDYVQLLKSCPRGTAWNLAILACDHTWNVDTDECVMKPIIQQEGQTDKPIVDDDSKCILDPELVPLRNCFLIFIFDRVIIFFF